MVKRTAFYKVMIVFLLFGLFAAGYFFVGSLQHSDTYDAAFFVDDLIPLIPFFIVFYVATYAFVVLPLFFVNGKRELNWLAINYSLILIVSFVIFLLKCLSRSTI